MEEIELFAKLAYYVLKESADEEGSSGPSFIGNLLAIGGIALGIGLLVLGVGLTFAGVWAVLALVVAVVGIVFLAFGLLVLHIITRHRGDLDRDASSARYTGGASSTPPVAARQAAYGPGGLAYPAQPADGLDRIGGAVGNLVSTTLHTFVPGALAPTAPARQQRLYQAPAPSAPYPSVQQPLAASPPAVSVLDRGDHYEVRAWAGTDDWSEVRWHAEEALVVVEKREATGDATIYGTGASRGTVRRESWSRLAVSMPGPFDASSSRVDLAGGWLTVSLPKA